MNYWGIKFTFQWLWLFGTIWLIGIDFKYDELGWAIFFILLSFVNFIHDAHKFFKGVD